MAIAIILILWNIAIYLIPFVESDLVITVNNDGDASVECCVNGTCPCGSLYYALQNLTSNSIINITSESVTLNTTTPIGSGNLHNITITGNGATIMCNNSGGVYCESCSDVIIEGITWDECYTNPLLVKAISISITNCVFWYDQDDQDVFYGGYESYTLYIGNVQFTAFKVSRTLNINFSGENFTAKISDSSFNDVVINFILIQRIYINKSYFIKL